jgi:hypothetical protein
LDEPPREDASEQALDLTLAGRAYVYVYLGALRQRLKAGAEAVSSGLAWLRPRRAA